MTDITVAANVTLSEVAVAAGVGESTVSRVLRKSGSVSSKTRERVMDAVNRLGYVPNRIAGTLASSGSPLVAVIVPSLSNIVFNDVLRGITAALEPSGHQAVFAVTDYDTDRETSLVMAMLAWRPSAIVLAGLEHTPETLRMLRASGCRIAELLDLDGTPLDIAVGFSNREAGRASARHLLARGYRRIGYLGHDIERDRRAGKRFAGFCAELEAAGTALTAQEFVAGESSIAAGRRGLATLLDRVPGLDAVYFSNDDMAIGGYFHCIAAQIAIPSSLALFGYNGLGIGAVTPQPLSTIRTPRLRVGSIAAKLITEGAAPQIVDVGFELIAGGTA